MQINRNNKFERNSKKFLILMRLIRISLFRALHRLVCIMISAKLRNAEKSKLITAAAKHEEFHICSHMCPYRRHHFQNVMHLRGVQKSGGREALAFAVIRIAPTLIYPILICCLNFSQKPSNEMWMSECESNE